MKKWGNMMNIVKANKLNVTVDGKIDILVRYLSGLFLAALALLYFSNSAYAQFDQAAPDAPPERYLASPSGVNFNGLDYVWNGTDLAIGDLSLTRLYGVGFGSPFPSWANNHNIHVIERPVDGGRPSTGEATGRGIAGVNGIVIMGNSSITFRRTSATNIYPTGYQPQGERAEASELSYAGNKFKYTDSGGTIYQFINLPNNRYASLRGGFRPSQKIDYIQYADGRKHDYTYNSTGQLVLLTSNQGYAIRFNNDSRGRLIEACAFNMTVQYVTTNTSCALSSLRISYGYSDSGLSSFTDVEGLVGTMSYDAGNRLTCVRIPGVPTCDYTNTYTYSGIAGDKYRATSQKTADGKTWTYLFTPLDQDTVANTPPDVDLLRRFGHASMTDPDGRKLLLKFYGPALEYTIEAGNKTDYQWNGPIFGHAYLPEGNCSAVSKKLRGVAIQIKTVAKGECPEQDFERGPLYPDDALTTNIGLPEPNSRYRCLSTSAILCNKPLYTIDPKGNRTDYSYASHGGLLSVTGPAVNGIRPQTRTQYQSRYAWVKNASGGYSRAATPIWVKTRDAFCISTAATSNGCAGGAADEVVTTYDYGPTRGVNNLLLRGVAISSAGKTLRTCYRYDALSRRISETQPKGTGSTCA